MPLSEEELRLLEQMERALVAEDPKFASALRGTTLRRNARRRSLIAGGVFLAGVVVLMTGAVLAETLVGIVGFVVMLGSAVVALTYWRSQSATPAQGAAAGADSPDQAFGLTVVEGGKSRKRQSKPKPKPKAKPGHGSMMSRFEERWRRRRDGQGGY